MWLLRICLHKLCSVLYVYMIRVLFCRNDGMNELNNQPKPRTLNFECIFHGIVRFPTGAQAHEYTLIYEPF